MQYVRVAPETLRGGARRTFVEHDKESENPRRLVFCIDAVTDTNQHRMVIILRTTTITHFCKLATTSVQCFGCQETSGAFSLS